MQKYISKSFRILQGNIFQCLFLNHIQRNYFYLLFSRGLDSSIFLIFIKMPEYKKMFHSSSDRNPMSLATRASLAFSLMIVVQSRKEKQSLCSLNRAEETTYRNHNRYRSLRGRAGKARGIRTAYPKHVPCQHIDCLFSIVGQGISSTFQILLT